MDESLLFTLAIIIFVGMMAQWLAWRLHLPSILLLLLFGFLVGPVSGQLWLGSDRWIDPDATFKDLLFPVVSLFVSIILFEGGLSLRLGELKEVGRSVRNLMTIGVAVTWGLCSVAAWWFLDLNAALATLFGAILTVTGPTVIGPLLRHVRPNGRVSSILKWEGIVNDPIGALLSVLVFEAILEGFHGTTGIVVAGILKTLLLGIGGGFLGAFVLVGLLKRYLIPDFLHNSVALSVAVITFAASNQLQHESGLLTVTVMGIVLANQKSVNVRHIVEFKENLRVLLISTLFILLAARLEIADLRHIDYGAAGFVAVLIFVIRPLAIFASTIGSKLSRNERIFLAWMAPRGVVAAAVASVFALRLGDQMPGAERLVPLMFIVIISTVTIYGLSALPLARFLGVSHPNPQGVLIVGAHRWARDIGRALQDEGFRVLLVDTNWENISAARMQGLATFYGSALSEYSLDEMDLEGVGKLIAVTPNDEVNSLATLHFAELFGRSNIYQIAVTTQTSPRKEFSMPRGRQLFGPDSSYGRLQAFFERGYRIRTTLLSEEFDADAYSERYPDGSVPLFCISDLGQLVIGAVDQPMKPRPGYKIIPMVPQHEEVVA